MKRKILLSVLIFFISLSFFGCNSNNNNRDEQKNLNTEENQNEASQNNDYKINVSSDEKIATETYVSYDNSQLIVKMKNNFDSDLAAVDIEVIYYDKNNNQISTDSLSVLAFKKDADFVSYLRLPRDDDYNYYVPSRVELKVEIDEDSQEYLDYEIYNDKIDINYKVVGDEVSVNIKNNSNVDLGTIDFVVAFTKNNKIISIEEVSTQLDIGELTTEEVEIPLDWDKSNDEDVPIDYDSIEVIVNRATTD